MNNKQLLLENLKIYNPCKDLGILKEVAVFLLKEYPAKTNKYLYDEENNYGLAFHICGYDGDAQQIFIDYIKNNYDVTVF